MIHHKDRMRCRGGGVCVYVSKHLPTRRHSDLENPHQECMWLWTRPTRLPRSITAIAVCVVYSPPDRSAQEQRELCADYLVSSTDSIRCKYPDCGIVTRPTRDYAILDLIITNLQSCYKTPDIFAPLGVSDHNSIMWIPKDKSNVCVKRVVRRYPESGLKGFGSWAGRNEWFSEVGSSPSTHDLALSLTADVGAAIDRFFPVKTVRFHPTDKPWITA